eukprot:scaffold2123_cov96-Cylindrotheca_fusiformis.AAC.11
MMQSLQQTSRQHSSTKNHHQQNNSFCPANSVETMNAKDREAHKVAQVRETVSEALKAAETIMKNRSQRSKGQLGKYISKLLSETLIVPPTSPEEREQQERYKNKRLMFGLRMSPLAFMWQPVTTGIEALRERIWTPPPQQKHQDPWHDFVLDCSSGSLVGQYTDDMIK